MKMYKINTLILLCLLNLIVFAQSKDEMGDFVEIVTFEDKNVSSFIKSVELLKKHCIRSGQYWYLEYRKENYLILSRSSVGKLFQSSSIRNSQLYLTIIDNTVLFLLDNTNEIPISKTGLKVDLKKYQNSKNLSVMDSTYWILKEVNGKIEILRNVEFSCN